MSVGMWGRNSAREMRYQTEQRENSEAQSPAEGNDSISKMCAMVTSSGLQRWFWTVSPSDIDSTPALRIAGIDVQFQLPPLQELAIIIAANPAAAARGFQALINSILRCLFSEEPQEPTRTEKGNVYCVVESTQVTPSVKSHKL